MTGIEKWLKVTVLDLSKIEIGWKLDIFGSRIVISELSPKLVL